MGTVLLKLLYAAVLGIAFIAMIVLSTVLEEKEKSKEHERKSQKDQE